MSVVLNDSALLEPISAEQPCGANLEDSPELASFDALRLFGQARSPEAPPDPEEKENVKEPPEWGELKGRALETLSRSKDLRVLAYLAAALLRTDGLPEYCQTLTVASNWLENYWANLYPVLDEDDAIARRNALNCFADPMATLDRLRRIALVESRQHGRFGLRDVDIATGQTPLPKGEPKPDEKAINAAFAEMPLDRLKTLVQSAANAAVAVKAIDGKMRSEGGPEVAPDFEPLAELLARMSRVLNSHLALRPDAVEPVAEEGGDADGAPAEGGPAGPARGGFKGGVIRTRTEAVKALDLVQEYFRTNEPSSPVPMFIERAKRLVAAKDFLEVLADIAPDAVSVARAAGGVKNE